MRCLPCRLGRRRLAHDSTVVGGFEGGLPRADVSAMVRDRTQRVGTPHMRALLCLLHVPYVCSMIIKLPSKFPHKFYAHNLRNTARRAARMNDRVA